MPPNQAVKRPREENQRADTKRAQQASGNLEPTMIDVGPDHTTASPTHPHTPRTPDPRQPRDSPPFRQMPIDHISTPQVQHSQYFTAAAASSSADHPAVAEAGPATPPAEKSVYNHIQVSESGMKLRPLTPGPQQVLKGWRSIVEPTDGPAQNNTKNIKVVSWNINGITGKREYLRLLMEKHVEPDIIFLLETKRQLVVSLYSELACDDNYRVVQLKSTATNSGGIVVIIKT